MKFLYYKTILMFSFLVLSDSSKVGYTLAADWDYVSAGVLCVLAQWDKPDLAIITLNDLLSKKDRDGFLPVGYYDAKSGKWTNPAKVTNPLSISAVSLGTDPGYLACVTVSKNK